MTFLWGLLATAGMLWPGHINGPLDGVPLDDLVKAVAIGLLAPALWWSHPRFLRTSIARLLIVGLLGWKAFTSVALVQEGLCARVMPSRPYARDAVGAPHSWDIRADWRSPDPACSAIMTRPYRALQEFPVWFFNLPPPNEGWPTKEDLPPAAHVMLTLDGFLRVPRAGEFRVVTSPSVVATTNVDGLSATVVPLAVGVHAVVINASLDGDQWLLAPTLTGADIWSSGLATVRRPTRLDIAFRPWGRWVAPALVGGLLLAWAGSALLSVGNLPILGWALAMSLVIGWLTYADQPELARWTIAALVAAAALPVPRRLRNTLGAFILLGVPWLTFIVVRSESLAGRFTLYAWGNDFWMFQRYAYRIVMQGYWLEGGSSTFWFQPLYRWIAGLLHLVFGDSSIGEWYWDGTCLLVSSLAAFRITKTFAGFRWALVAAALTLAVFSLGTAHTWLGVGLGEISSAGFIYLAVFFVLKAWRGDWRAGLIAGLLVTLGFYTRLNNLLMGLGVCAFALPPRLSARLARSSRAWAQTSWRTMVFIVATLGAGLLFLAWRTWHYTGIFSVFYGTQRDFLALWQPGLSIGTWLTRVLGSVAMVLTVNDPPRLDVYALPVLLGSGVGVLSLLGVPRLRSLPLSLPLFFVAALSGAFIARGSAYSGRFSVHIIAITCALVCCGAAALTGSPAATQRRL